MPRNITVTLEDGTKHIYQDAPDDVTPEQVSARAQKEFGKSVTALDGGRKKAAISPEMNAYLDQKQARDEGVTAGLKDFVINPGRALLEGGGKIASSIVAKPVSEVAGLSAAAKDVLTGNKDGDPQGFRDFVRDSLTYQPRNAGGNLVVAANPLNAVGAPLNALTGAAAGLVNSDKSSPGYQGTQEALNQAIGLAGAKTGILARPASAGAQKVADALTRTVNAVRPTGIAERKLVDLAGDNKALVADSLAKGAQYVPNSPVTSQEAIAQGNMDSPQAHGAGIVKLQQDLARVPGYTQDKLSTIANQQKAARLKQITGMTGDVDAAMAARTAETAPMREAELAAANTAAQKLGQLDPARLQKQQSVINALQDKGRMQTEVAQQDRLSDTNWKPGSDNINRVPEYQGAATDFASLEKQRKAERDFIDYKIGSLESHGLRPLQASQVTDSIDAVLKNPAMGASDVVSGALGKIKDKINQWTDGNGVIDANALYTIRKEAGNTISQMAKENNNWDKRLTGGLERDVQKSIDDAIVKAGGTGWKAYLNNFSEASKKIDDMKSAQALAGKLNGAGGKERATQYSNARADNPFNDPANEAKAATVDTDLNRVSKVKEMARETSSPGDTTPQIPQLPMMLNPAVSVANKVARHVFGDLNTKANRVATDILADPAKLREVMTRPKSDGTRKVVEAVIRAGQVSSPYYQENQ